MRTWTTPNGQIVKLEQSELEERVYIDGQQAEVLCISRYRDGGTTEYDLVLNGEAHALILHRRLYEQPWESLDGQALTPSDEGGDRG